MTDDLVLYVAPGCGYCEDVRAEAARLQLDLQERNAWGDSSHGAALVAARGRRTVPVLRIRREGGDEWMGESARIIAYLRERFGDGEHAPRSWRRWASHRGVTMAMWGLLLAGGMAPEPGRSVLWTSASTLAAVRSFTLAARSGSPIQWAVGVAFATGAVSIPLHALGVADLPWWWVAFAVIGIAVVTAWARVRARQT